MFKNTMLFVLAGTLLAPVPAPSQETESWRITVDLSAAGAGELEMIAVFNGAEATPTGTLSIAAQGVTAAALTDVVYTETRIEFTFAVTPAAVFTADRSGDSATGQLRQGGGEFPMRMERLADGAPAGPARPQTPQPPFPYETREVSYVNPADDTTLAGSLTVPEGAGPHPAALLITGSGSQDRDETLFGHKPFWVIADYLSRRGIAVLRVDDRGVGGSGGVRPDLTTADFVGDVRAGLTFLRAVPGIDAARLGLIGHSEGGMIAPMVAAEDPELAYIVMLAGTGVDGYDILKLQNRLLLEGAGVAPEAIDRQLEIQTALWTAIEENDDAEIIDGLLRDLIEFQLSGAPEGPREAAFDGAMARGRQQIASAWFRYFLVTDPVQFLERVRCPVLALNGTLDRQVDAEQNLPQIEAALRRGGNVDVTTRRLDGLNHLFQHAGNGMVSEYGTIEETIAPEVLELVDTWIRARVGLE